MAPLILNKFCCFSLEQATRGAPIYVICAGTIALFLLILDQVAAGVDGFEIEGGFKSWWRVLIWKQWLACDIVMICAHIALIVMSAMLIYAIRPSRPIYKRLATLRAWFAVMICYTITEVAIGTYQYSWYGKNSFRRPYLCFTIFFFTIRMVSNILAIIVVNSRIHEIKAIVMAPVDKKMLYNIDGWASTQSGLERESLF
ncbi:uncharacterized protein LOC135493208 isoform X2 [Lineus longissimus]|uniref:uncharacterized protein LOC135493208 isoform X2 n=1 Tax=Lineus longissimus TaxID=88925 RepID=UPI002B4C8B14